MQQYMVKRLFLAVPTIFGAITLVFFAMHFAPGDPIALFVPSYRSGQVKDEVVQEMRKRYGFDKPVHEQYLTYLGNMARLNFGRSMRQDTVITEDLRSRVVQHGPTRVRGTDHLDRRRNRPGHHLGGEAGDRPTTR